ncbi:transporter substrate-binding domain-containing protein [Oscillospiraceae bacterium MB08-C2-2]|nr:transporter substrate-binding domain-containing protein [Oscillospiraceae bacterium MB08-C2-2]
MKKKSLTGILAAVLVVSLAACGQTAPAAPASSAGSEAPASTAEASPGVEKVYVAHTQSSKPMNYVNEKGESDGYEVKVMKLIDELLPEYEFEFVPTSDDDLLIGIETGKYDVGTKGAWWTEERSKKFIFPKEAIGASSIGILVRTADSETVTDLLSFAKTGGKLVPIAPNNAQYNVILEYNKENPDNAINLEAADTFEIADAYQWVIEGRYDAFFCTKTSYVNNVTLDESPYSQYNDQLKYIVHRSLPTWPLFNKENQAFADAYDKAFKQLLDSGKINEVMHEYLGENTFDYL